MSKNINQVFIANPITSNASTDLMYFGQSPYGAGDDAAMTYANFSAQFGAPYTASALTSTSDTNVTMTLSGTPETALLHAASITMGWSGQLSLTRGGTNASLTASNGGIFYSTATAGAILSGTATANQVLLSGASAAPSWSTATYPATTTVNQILYSSSANIISGITTANNGVLVTSAGGVPSISSTLPLAVQSNITQVGTISSGTWNGSVITGTYGGTGVNNGTNTATYAGNLNFANSFTTSGNFAVTQTYTGITNVTFPTSGTLATTTQIPSGAALTKVDDTNVTMTLGGSPTTALVNAASMTLGWTGQLSGTRGGTGVNNGASTITIGGSVTFSGAFTFTGTLTGNTSVTFPTSGTLATTSQVINVVDQTSSSVTLAPNTLYVIDNGASLVTLTYPASSAIGDTYYIIGKSSGGWKVAQLASQLTHLGSSVSTTGTGGSLASSNANDCVIITCTTASTAWTAYGAQGNITVV